MPAARPRASEATGLAVLTCSGGDSALAADYCERSGLRLPALADRTARRLRELLPRAATVGNPLDYTALIWGEDETLRDIVVTVAEDPAIDHVVVLYDQPAGIEGAAEESWSAVREGILAGAGAARAPVMVASTLPELLDDEAAARFAEAGLPAIAGLRTGLVCAAALREPAGDPVRLRAIGAAAARGSNGRAPLAEHEAKELLRAAGVPVVEGRLAAGEDDAAGALTELGPPLALKLSARALAHKSELRALALELRSAEEVRSEYRRLVGLGVPHASVLVERMASAGRRAAGFSAPRRGGAGAGRGAGWGLDRGV